MNFSHFYPHPPSCPPPRPSYIHVFLFLCEPVNLILFSCLRMDGRLFSEIRKLINGYPTGENCNPPPNNH